MASLSDDIWHIRKPFDDAHQRINHCLPYMECMQKHTCRCTVRAQNVIFGLAEMIINDYMTYWPGYRIKNPTGPLVIIDMCLQNMHCVRIPWTCMPGHILTDGYCNETPNRHSRTDEVVREHSPESKWAEIAHWRRPAYIIDAHPKKEIIPSKSSRTAHSCLKCYIHS